MTDNIIYNGVLMTPGQIGSLMNRSYIYQKIHSYEQRLLFVRWHLEIAFISSEILYGNTPQITALSLHDHAIRLLESNRYHTGSVELSLYILSPAEPYDAPDYLLTTDRQLLYRGLTLWHKPLSAILLEYEPPFAAHLTAASQAAHNYAAHYARMQKCDLPITLNHLGEITGCGETPLFAVRGNTLITSPYETGVPESVGRRIVFDAAEKAGMDLIEEPVVKKELNSYDELFTITTQGIASIGRIGDRLFPGSIAAVIADHISLSDGNA